jgi:hypothetical protein
MHETKSGDDLKRRRGDDVKSGVVENRNFSRELQKIASTEILAPATFPLHPAFSATHPDRHAP